MPARVARSSTSQGKATTARKKSQKRTLDAFSIASHSAPERTKIRQHRLGESIGEGPRSKRRRLQDDDEDEDDEEHASNARRLQHKNVDKRTGGGLDEETDEGSDSEGNEWRMGGHIGEDSDSSLDSDEAFGESDEERFEGFTFRGSSTTKPGASKKKKAKSRQATAQKMDLDEESEADDDSEEDDDFGDEGVDLATMLDDSASDDEQPKSKDKSKKKAIKSAKPASDDEDEDMFDEDDEDDDEDEDDEEEDSDDSDGPPSEAESDDADPTKLSKLQDLIASLDNDPPEKRTAPRTADVHESQQPSAFGLSASQKLKISDLLPTVTDPALRKSLKLLSSDKTSKRSSGPGKLDAPLPKRQQDRLDRTVATQAAKETLDKWRDTVVHNRRAEFLQFPLQDPNATAPLGQNTMIAVQQEKPQNDLESAIQNILVESGLSNKGKPGNEESQLQEFEELKMNKIPIEEVMARRADLRKARELLFREEAKAKRIKKIKSKSYRRVHRKERERQEAKDQEFREAEGIESDEDEKEKRDRKRAEERMGTKHRDSKWAKGMKKSGRTVWDDDARDSMLELARRNEDLRKRIEGKDVDYHTDSDFSEEEEDDDDMEDEDATKKRLSKKLDKLDEEPKERSKLGDMLFMKRAEASRRAQNDEDIERMRKELASDESGDDEDADTTVGRRSFGPKASNAASARPKVVRAELEENPASDEEDAAAGEEEAEIIVDRPATSNARKPKSILKQAPVPAAKAPEPSVDDTNEWLSTSTKSKKKSRKDKKEDEPIVSTKVVKPAKEEVVVKQSKSAEKQPKAAAAQATATSTDGWTTIPYTGPQDDKEDAADAEDTENLILSSKDKQALFHQRAFAGDDVAVDFEAEKAAQMEDEDDKEVSTHLPGWGSWTGDGLSKAVKKQNKRMAHNPLRKQVIEGVKAANRKDAKLQNVVISEAQQRKSKKYLASQLPHQFEKRDQYERSLRIPVGPEWTTKETFQRNTRPRVVVKQGIVAPMEKPMI